MKSSSRNRLEHLPRWAALGLALVATGAAPQVVDIAWDAAGRSEHSLMVAPGKVAEVCGKLTKGQTVAWNFKADRALDFNIHYHAGKDVVFPAKRDASAGASGKLEVGVDQDYCWMWANKAAAAARFELLLSR